MLRQKFLTPRTPALQAAHCLHSTQAADRPRINIVEVSPRDGLQNESTLVSADVRASLISRLVSHGFRTIEAGSFVSPKLRQMANTKEVLLHPDIRRLNAHGLNLPILIPNMRGMQDLLATCKEAGEDSESWPTREIALFVGATESFSKANTNVSISEALDRSAKVAELALSKGMRVRGYVSCAAGCPYEGKVAPEQVASIGKALVQAGCYEISLGDTTGVAVPSGMEAVLQAVTAHIPVSKIAAHCHDTYGTAIANILHVLKLGVRTVDSSVGGLGGCPHAPGAAGNVATEDVVYALELEGYDTGVVDSGNREDLDKALEGIAETGEWICGQLGRRTGSKVGRAILARKRARELAQARL